MGLILSNAGFFDYQDWRWVGKNMLEPATAGAPGIQATLAQMLDPLQDAGRRIAEFINLGEDMLFSAAMVGKRYTVQQVVQFGGALSRWIVAYLAVSPVLGRRDRAATDEKALSVNFNLAMDYTERLRSAERIFYAVPAVPEAGLPGTAPQAPVPGINPQLVTQRAWRYFGTELNPTVYGGIGPPPG